MKKERIVIALAVFCLLFLFPLRAEAAFVCKTNSSYFPDEAFREYVAENLDPDKDGYLYSEEIAEITYIDVTGLGIRSLDGIWYFTSLDTLYCCDNDLTVLNLTYNTGLTELDCSNNRLTDLKLDGLGLYELYCSHNRLSSLDVSIFPELEGLDCSFNKLTSLDVSKNPMLYNLECTDNMITELKVSSCPRLMMIRCNGNRISSMNISKNSNIVRAFFGVRKTLKNTDGSDYCFYEDDRFYPPFDASGIGALGDNPPTFCVDKTTSVRATPFTDVKPASSYQNAVAWAYTNGITKGRTSKTFDPSAGLTRGEFCTMLWRMFGKQSTSGMKCPFADAKKSNHYQAILWCYNKGIIKGYKEGGKQLFKPSQAITRGNILVMLYKLAKNEPDYTEPSIANPFKDVKSKNKNISAYKWAYQNGITTTTNLKPGVNCTRASMVSFLYGYDRTYCVIKPWENWE